MKEFPHDRYVIEKCLKNTDICCTFLVKPRHELLHRQILKLYIGGESKIRDLKVADELVWEKELEHPLILGITDAGLSGRSSFYTTRTYSNSTFELDKASSNVIGQILSGIAFLHSCGRPHGSLRPSNLISGDGGVCLADRLLLSSSHHAIDHIHYIAPEILAGSPITIEGDYYSIGAILFRIYYGRNPYEDSNIDNLVSKYAQLEIPSVRHAREIRSPLPETIHGLLDKNPRNRAIHFENLIREIQCVTLFPSKIPSIGRRDLVRSIQSTIESPGYGFRVVLVEGDAGLGKTRLVDALRFRSNLCFKESFRSYCFFPSEKGLSPLTRILRQIVLNETIRKRRSLREILGVFADHLEPFFERLLQSDDQGIDLPSERIIQDLIGLIGEWSRSNAIVMFLEDIDKADSSTLHLLQQLCNRTSEVNIRLILTCRDTSTVPWLTIIQGQLGQDFRHVILDELPAHESRELIRLIEPSTESQTLLIDRVGGNPMWLLRAASEHQNRNLDGCTSPSLIEALGKEYADLTNAIALANVPASLSLLATVVASNPEWVQPKLVFLRKIGIIRTRDFTFEIRNEGLRSAIQSKMSARSIRTVHRKFYAAIVKDSPRAHDSLAHHALKGSLWNEAGNHYCELIRSSSNRGDNVSAVSYYKTAELIFKKLKSAIPIEIRCDHAISLVRMGKSRVGAKLYSKLLGESAIDDELRIRLLLVSNNGDRDSIHLDLRLSFLRDAIQSARIKQDHISILLSRFCTSSVTAGDLVSAEEALNRSKGLLTNESEEKGRWFTKAAEAFLLMNRGHFQTASELYRSLACEPWGAASAILTNRSVCLEQLGDIRNAIAVQKKGYRFASEAGHLFAQIQCLTNLAIYEAKLGHLEACSSFFIQADKLIAELSKNSGGSNEGMKAERAQVEFLQGKCEDAIQRLRKATSTANLFKRQRYQSLLLECEILMAIGAGVTAADIDRITAEGAWTDSPLYFVQEALLRSRIVQETDAISILENALRVAAEGALLYEVCRLELELSVRTVQRDVEESKQHAETALRIARKNGYRPLQAKALLRRGIASSHDKEREHFLSQSVKLATEIGISETLSESSYHLGLLLQSARRFTAAREHLSNSTRITSGLVRQLPARYRLKYLSEPWRRDARARLDACVQDLPVGQLSPPIERNSGDQRYFQALYQVTIAASSAATTDDFIRDILTEIGLSRYNLVVMLRSGDHTSWHSFGVTVTDELRNRVAAISQKSGGQIRFEADNRWIPFRSETYSGGIFVTSRGRSGMDEGELEFFTILGTLVGSAFDQIRNRNLSKPLAATATNFHGIVGNSRPIAEMCSHIENIARSNATVLIEGETGSGKELVARAIHKLSSRSSNPFIPIDCGAIPENLMESELFGSRRGSFTGAVADRPGVFEAAHRGTLFLDEISNMNPAMQAKLLRVLQEREVRRIGESRSRPVDVRLIAATNAALKKMVADGTFRQDLLFRLNVIEVQIPPLRERLGDIPVLAGHFLRLLNSTHKTNKIFGPDAFLPLLRHKFPGNVRELQNAVERSFFISSTKTIASIVIDPVPGDPSVDEVRKWFNELSEGRRNFWTEIHDRYKRRDIPRDKVVALVDLGLRRTRGSYRDLAALFRINKDQYRRLMDFLRRNDCLLDFRPYRRAAAIQ